jgi:CIC family chloride channel protein
LFLILTIIIGVAAGLTAVLFSVCIDLLTRVMFGPAASPVRLVAVPVMVSLLVGIVLAYVVPDVRGSGVPQTKAAYALAGGVIPARVPIGKFILGILTIGSGQSMGREGPSVQIGAGLASVVGRWLHLSPQRVRDLVPVGAAGALAAAFNTPVAAVLFALEEIIGDMNAPLLGSTVVASVSSVIVERSILGNEPLFHVPTYRLVHPGELAAYAMLGILGGVVSLVFCKSLLGLRHLFQRLPPATRAWQPAVGGVTVGALLLVTPAVMGVGYDYVDQALNSGLVLPLLLLFGGLKLLATVASYASGNAGGIFAPSLYIGAMLGGAVGVVVHGMAPAATAEPGAYALVGMGTLFAGIIRAPLTSVFMIFEITQDYQILVPLMLANMLSFLISRRYQPVAVYDALLRQDQIHLPAHAVRRFAPGRSARDLMNASREVLAEPPPVHVHPDHPVDVVFERFEQSGGVLPVVSRAHANHVEGIITVETITASLGRQDGGAER